MGDPDLDFHGPFLFEEGKTTDPIKEICPIVIDEFPLKEYSPTKLEKLCNDPETRELTQSILRGNFKMVWLAVDTGGGCCRFLIHFYDSTTSDGDIIDGNCINTAACIRLFVDVELDPRSQQLSTRIANGTSGILQRNLPVEIKQLVTYRACHYFLKYRGLDVPQRLWDPIHHDIVTFYTNKKWFVDAYDCAALDARRRLANPTENYIFRWNACVRAGEALEACQKYVEAGGLYERASAMFEQEQRAGLLSNAGLAYKIDGMHVEAEKLYVQSVHENTGGRSNANSFKQCVVDTIMWMILNYEMWSDTIQREGTGQPGLPNESEKAWLPFMSLLYVAGYGSSMTGKSKDLVEVQGKSIHKILLKPPFKRRDKARKTLIKAFEHPDVGHFREVLQSAMNPKAYATVVFVDRNNEWTHGTSEYKSHMKQVSRDQMRSNLPKREKELELLVCQNCGKSREDATLKRCPCQTVVYCGVECQREHWKKEHKHKCPGKQGK